MKQKQNSIALMDEAFGLLMIGYAPMKIREKLGVTVEEWGSIQRDSYWHSLVLGGGDKTKEQKELENIEECRRIGKELYLTIELMRMWEDGSEEKAKLNTKYEELKKLYASMNPLNVI